jgi:hypothetical protein
MKHQLKNKQQQQQQQRQQQQQQLITSTYRNASPNASMVWSAAAA